MQNDQDIKSAAPSAEDVTSIQGLLGQVRDTLRMIGTLIDEKKKEVSKCKTELIEREEAVSKAKFDAEGINVSHALGQITDGEAEARMSAIRADMEANQAAKNAAEQKAAQILDSISALERQAEQTRQDAEPVRQEAEKILQEFLKADALSAVNEYLQAADQARLALMKLAGLDRIISDQGIAFRLLPINWHSFYLVNPCPAPDPFPLSWDKGCFFHAEKAILYTPGFERQCHDKEVERLNGLGISLKA